MTDTTKQPSADVHDVLEPVRALMMETVAFVDSDTSLRMVVETMADKGLGALIVLGSDGPSQIVSERDVVRALARGARLEETLAIDVASTDLVVAGPDDQIIEAARLMGEHGIWHVPVMSESGVVGVVSARDVLRVLSSQVSPPQEGSGGAR
jgi:CBS domain-containing protein